MKVSIVIPYYNGQRFLEGCLRSVSQQEYRNIEPILIDDGSEDQSNRIVEKWNKSNPLKFNLIRTKNKGSANARNLGLAIATGDYIQFLDVDDLLENKKISNQVDLITDSESMPDFVAGSYLEVSNSGSGKIHIPYSEDSWDALITSRLGVTSANLFNKTTLDEINGFDTNQISSQEYELMFRIMMKKNFKIIFDHKVNTVKQNVNPASISLSNNSQNSLRYLQLRAKIRDYMVESGFDEKHISDCENEIFREVRRLYNLDKKSAIKCYNNHINRKFSPSNKFEISRKKLPSYYKLIYQLFGFKVTEMIYSNINSIKILIE